MNRLNFHKYVLLALISIVLIALPLQAADESVTRKLEYIPLYKYVSDPQTALKILKDNLVQLGIGEDRATVTILPLEPNKIAVQSDQAVIDIVKTLMKNIDPPPPPPLQPPAAPQDLITSIRVKYLHPTDLWKKLDEVMNNFMSFKRFDTGADNIAVYARGDGNQNRINFFIPDYALAEKDFLSPKQGYMGYKVYIRATQAEKPYVDTLNDFLGTIDKPVDSLKYEIIPICYVEMKECINQLKAAGYTAIYTADTLDQAVLQSIKNGISPVIYSAPKYSGESTAISTQFSGGTSAQIRGNQFQVLTYPNPTTTVDSNNLIVYGSKNEIESIRNFVALVDVPAKQIQIEAQIIEINIDDLHDLGLRSVKGMDDIVKGSVSPKFPGESSATSQEDTATIFTYDDAGLPAGSFQASIAALILEGKATIRARPKVTTVDGRQAIITIVRQVPVAQETVSPNNDRSTFDISFVPVGITLNIKPRIGRNNSEIQMQVNAVVSNVETINNVVSGLNIQAPELNTREVSTIVRIPNHQSLILGGLISTQSERRTYKVPLFGDLPLIGKLFSRTKMNEDRTEIIIVLTPHVAEEIGGRTDVAENPFETNDELFKPTNSPLWDALENMITPLTYVIKYPDIQGIDPLTREPIGYKKDEKGAGPPLGSANDPVFLTVRKIVDSLKLVDKLNLEDHIVFPSVFPDSDEERRLFAEAFIIDYIIVSNNMTLDDLASSRTILIPSLNVDELKDLDSEVATRHYGENIFQMAENESMFKRIRDSLKEYYSTGKTKKAAEPAAKPTEPAAETKSESTTQPSQTGSGNQQK